MRWLEFYAVRNNDGVHYENHRILVNVKDITFVRPVTDNPKRTEIQVRGFGTVEVYGLYEVIKGRIFEASDPDNEMTAYENSTVMDKILSILDHSMPMSKSVLFNNLSSVIPTAKAFDQVMEALVVQGKVTKHYKHQGKSTWFTLTGKFTKEEEL